MSVFLTVRDEEQHLEEAIDGVLGQDYAGELEVVIAVGPSTDRTMEIAQGIAARDRRVRVVENPTGATPAGLNLAIKATRYDVLVRVDGHSAIAVDYISRVVERLETSGAANVGGIMRPEGRTGLERAIARAMSSPVGIGVAPFHTGGKPGPADSVYLGAFRRAALEAVGGYDEEYLRAQDWELNYRLRNAGHVVWFDPGLVVTYRPRNSWRAFARQFFRSGRWRRHVISRHPDTSNLRYLAPPAVVAGSLLGLVVGTVGAIVGPEWLRWAFAVPAAYVAGVLVAVVPEMRGLPVGAAVRLPGVVMTMHGAWGFGFLRGSEVARRDRGVERRPAFEPARTRSEEFSR